MERSVSFKSNRGVTLIELIASVAIFAIIVGPFLGSFLSAHRNNISAEEKLSAAALSQKAMEEIKISPADYINSDPLLADSFTTYAPASDTVYTTEYNVKKVLSLTNITPSVITGAPEYNLDPQNITNPALDFLVGRNNVKLNGSTFSHLSEYVLHISYDSSTGRFQYSFYSYGGSEPEAINLATDSGPIDVKILFDQSRQAGDNPFNLHLNIDNSIGSKEVRIYPINVFGQSNLQLINEGGKGYIQIDGLDAKNLTYNNDLYRITVQVLKGNKKLNTLVSYVKK